MKSDEMKHGMTLVHTMGPSREILFQTDLLVVTIHGLMWSSLVKLLTENDPGPFKSGLLPCTPLYQVMPN